MTLSATDRATFERWCGRVRTDDDEAAVEERIARLGNAHMAALEHLQINRADMVLTASRIRSGDDSVDHTANLAKVELVVSQLVTVIIDQGLSTDDELVQEAAGKTAGATESITIEARNRRRG